MDFDERLHRTFDALAERLDEEIATQLNIAAKDVSAAFAAECDAAVAEAGRQARTIAECEADERLTKRLASAEIQARAHALASERSTMI